MEMPGRQMSAALKSVSQCGQQQLERGQKGPFLTQMPYKPSCVIEPCGPKQKINGNLGTGIGPDFSHI